MIPNEVRGQDPGREVEDLKEHLALIRQKRPDSGRLFHSKAVEISSSVPSWLGSVDLKFSI